MLNGMAQPYFISHILQMIMNRQELW